MTGGPMKVRLGVFAALSVTALALAGCSGSSAAAPSAEEPDLSDPAVYILGDWTCELGARESYTLSISESEIAYTAYTDDDVEGEGTVAYTIDSLNLLTTAPEDGSTVWTAQFPEKIVGGATDQVVVGQAPRVIEFTTTWSSDSVTFENPNLGGSGSCERD